MAITITIGGSSRNSAVTGFRISQRLGQRATADVTTADRTASWLPQQGQEIIIASGGSTIFGGIVDTVERYLISGIEDNAKTLGARLACSDYTQYLDRHRVAGTFGAMSPADIISAILLLDDGGTSIAGDGITATAVESLPDITDVVFSYCTATEALDQLALLAGARWWLDSDKDIHFTTATAVTAPFSITSTSAEPLAETVRVTDDASQYANRVILKCNSEIVEAQTETFTGDGATQGFYTTRPLGEAPTITLIDNSVDPPEESTQTVGVFEVDTGCDWYWHEGWQAIYQDFGNPPIPATSDIRVVYYALWSNIVTSQDDGEIAARALIEGGTGLHSIMLDDSDSTTLDQAQEKADAELRRRKTVASNVYYSTDTAVEPGQIQTITLAAHGVDDDYLIQAVSIYDRGDHHLRYDVETILGEARPDWVKSLAAALGGTYAGRFVASSSAMEAIAYPA